MGIAVLPRRPLNNLYQQVRSICHHCSRAHSKTSQLVTTRRDFGPLLSRNPSIPKPALRSTNCFPARHFSTTSILCKSSKVMTDADIESAKRAAAAKAVSDWFDPEATHVGIGSGSTIKYVVEAIQKQSNNPRIRFVPTGWQSRQVIIQAGLTPIAFDSLPESVMLDIAFDGADEVDEELNCIKGGGACLFQEKLVAERARKFICVADYRKNQSRLLTNWPTIPIEVAPIAVPTVLRSLRTLGSTNPQLRTTTLEKSGPLKTDQDFFIIDAPFKPLLTARDLVEGKGKGDGSDGTWEVDRLCQAIKRLTGVLEVGIFSGLNGIDAEGLREKAAGKSVPVITGGQKPVAVYFGMQDGSVQQRQAGE
ncbi:ribose 5-phosphate isomerase [Lophiostoma macrostomum CBS 122681]|uniref:Ribose-5-phosphate isomerase n=1 Tax=Lophiostoma macrostomum CBS 122681 TaxID=1314788 RepID=A0A6A6TG77_9PLEO|nr:ribose 5-phosphate isomerase [Lophiostoma macrostomum CBS 122681]